MIYQRSSKLFKTAKNYLAGGVNSPVRAFKAVGGTPIFIKYAKGAYLFDEDGNKFIDYISSWGPMILGHAYESVINAISEIAKNGTSFGTPTEIETEIAKLVISKVSNIDKIRFVNSGTEACMSSIRLARGYTKRDKILKFAGCYHGHSDSFLIKAGSGASTFGVPTSLGITRGTSKDTLVADYNNLDSVKKHFKEFPDQIAAIILEPIAGNMGCIPPKLEFIQNLRRLCDNYGSILIFDEVMTGFRVGLGGAQESLKVNADIVAFGKIIGGGLPVGAFAASNKIMESLAPDGLIYQAGTLSGNPLAMIAGLTTLKEIVNDPDIYSRLEEKTKTLKFGMEKVLNKKGIPFKINMFGSMISLHFTETEVFDFISASKGDNNNFKKYFNGMLREGIYLPPSAYESCFLNDALSYDDIDFTLNAFDKVISSI